MGRWEQGGGVEGRGGRTASILVGRCQPGRELVRGSRPAAWSQQLLGGRGEGTLQGAFLLSPPFAKQDLGQPVSRRHQVAPPFRNRGPQELSERNFAAHPTLGSKPS